MSTKVRDQFHKEHHHVLHSIRMSRIILPVLIGLGVVGYLMWKQFDPEEFAKIRWTPHADIWIFMAVAFLVVRHLAYAYRLRLLSDQQFSWWKCIKLIFIWEFSSAISPTSIGGSAVALFVLAQEKLSTARVATIVLYTVVLDTLFFIVALPPLILVFGLGVIHPTMHGLSGLNAWGVSFGVFFLFMFAYALLFYYGLFVNPGQMKRMMVGFTKIWFLKKYPRGAVELGDNMIATSKAMKLKGWQYHLAAFGATFVAWSCRFLLLSSLIIAFVPETSLHAGNQLMLYGRQIAMWVLTAFSPTPGGSGIIEVVFGGYLSDFIPIGISAIVAFLWRFLTYYFYLIAGVIVVPNWIRTIINRHRKHLEELEAA
jgi:hypothetical protein